MPFNFNKEEIVEATFEHGGETLDLKIRKNVLTPKKLREINEKVKAEISVKTGMEAEVAGGAVIAETLSLMLASWSEKSVKPTAEFLETCPFNFLTDLLAFCQEQINPKQKTAAT